MANFSFIKIKITGLSATACQLTDISVLMIFADGGVLGKSGSHYASPALAILFNAEYIKYFYTCTTLAFNSATFASLNLSTVDKYPVILRVRVIGERSVVLTTIS